MNGRAYYNEFDQYAAAFLRNLIEAGHIAPGDVDERSIVDVRPSDLTGYSQCHFFAGIGGWSRALRLAGVPDDCPAWTGSCPCQPFSAAGKGGGFDDERHLWPAFHWLIDQCRPRVVFGEQVASKDGLGWLDLVQADLEGSGYAFAANDLCAAGIGAPHIRQRLYFVAEPDEGQWGPRRTGAERARGAQPQPTGSSAVGLVGHALDAGLEGLAGDGDDTGGRALAAGSVATAGDALRVADTEGERGGEGRSGRHAGHPSGLPDDAQRHAERAGDTSRSGPTNGVWRDADWLRCRDGKWRPVEPGTFPLAHGVPARVGRLRAYGNAIVPPLAAEFVKAALGI